MPLEIGSIFAGHRLDEEAGRGGMGVVYRARNVITEREVALKVLVPELARDVRFRTRFKRESRLSARLEHEHVIPLHHAGEDEGLLYLVMRYVEGTDLRSLLVERGALTPGRALEIVAQVAAALDAAHALGLIHRDVKPANVLIERGGDGSAYLTDFGLVKDLGSESSLTESGAFMGTYHYAAPEQLDSRVFGSVSHRTDVYALGCLLYHCLAGEVPYPRDTPGAIVAAHLFHDPPDVRAARPELASGLTAVIERALAKRPENRYSTAGEFATAAMAALEPTSTRQVGEIQRRPAPQAIADAPPPPREAVANAAPARRLPPAQPSSARAYGQAPPDPGGPRPIGGSPGRASGGFKAPWIALAVLVAIALIGGGLAIGGVFSSDAKKNTASTPPASTRAPGASTAAMPPPSAIPTVPTGTPSGGGYPPGFVEKLISSCAKGGKLSASQCQCWFTKLKNAYTFPQLTEVIKKAQGGNIPPKAVSLLRTCLAQ